MLIFSYFSEEKNIKRICTTKLQSSFNQNKYLKLKREEYKRSKKNIKTTLQKMFVFERKWDTYTITL